MSGLLHYKQGEKQSGIEEMKNAIQIFEWVGSENLANNYKKILSVLSVKNCIYAKNEKPLPEISYNVSKFRWRFYL